MTTANSWDTPIGSAGQGRARARADAAWLKDGTSDLRDPAKIANLIAATDNLIAVIRERVLDEAGGSPIGPPEEHRP